MVKRNVDVLASFDFSAVQNRYDGATLYIGDISSIRLQEARLSTDTLQLITKFIREVRSIPGSYASFDPVAWIQSPMELQYMSPLVGRILHRVRKYTARGFNYVNMPAGVMRMVENVPDFHSGWVSRALLRHEIAVEDTRMQL